MFYVKFIITGGFFLATFENDIKIIDGFINSNFRKEAEEYLKVRNKLFTNLNSS